MQKHFLEKFRFKLKAFLLIFRKFVDGAFRFFLVGVVTGNPSGCFPKTLPDVFNFVGNLKVSID